LCGLIRFLTVVLCFAFLCYELWLFTWEVWCGGLPKGCGACKAKRGLDCDGGSGVCLCCSTFVSGGVLRVGLLWWCVGVVLVAWFLFIVVFVLLDAGCGWCGDRLDGGVLVWIDVGVLCVEVCRCGLMW